LAKATRDIPQVADALGRILKKHATELAKLRVAAAQALNRARVNAADLESQRSQSRKSQHTVDLLARQIGQLRQSRNPLVDAEIRDLNSRIQQGIAEVSRATANADRLQEQVCRICCGESGAKGFREDEESLNAATARQLNEIRFGSLKDPGRLSSIASGVVRVLSSVVELGVKVQRATWDSMWTGLQAIGWMFHDLFTGDWENFLWSLKKVLAGALTVLSIAALIFSGGALLPALVLGFALLNLATGLALMGSGAEDDREDGRTYSNWDLALDAVQVVGAGLGYHAKPNFVNVRSVTATEGVVIGRGATGVAMSETVSVAESVVTKFPAPKMFVSVESKIAIQNGDFFVGRLSRTTFESTVAELSGSTFQRVLNFELLRKHTAPSLLASTGSTMIGGLDVQFVENSLVLRMAEILDNEAVRVATAARLDAVLHDLKSRAA
jgi:hypothetical protein